MKKIDPKTIITTPQTLGFCKRSYPDHPNGCPNIEKCWDLNLPFFKDKWREYRLLYADFDFKSYKEWRKNQHPSWSDRQVACCLYWQNSVKSLLTQEIEELYITEGPFYVYGCGSGLKLSFQDSVGSMELTGINVFSTMKLNGIDFEISPENKVILCTLLCFNGKQKKF
ncbi:MAG: hypothetical protein ACOC4M_15995 [Promethearchaeia archaeon]